MYYVYPNIGRFGLGNKLCVWARAELFANEHDARIIAPSFVQFPSLGALLRGERYLRANIGNFDFSESGYVCGLRRLVLLSSRKRIKDAEWTEDFSDGIVEFVGLGKGTFSKVLKNHQLIIDRLKTITSRQILDDVNILAKTPFIGVHVRRGDFLQAGVMTSDEWYVKAIAFALNMVGDGMPIKVFSDAREKDLLFLRDAFPRADITIMPAAKPLHDIWALSKSAVMVGSSRSSFSIWATLLGQMPSVWAKQNAPNGKSLYLDAAMTPVILE